MGMTKKKLKKARAKQGPKNFVVKLIGIKRSGPPKYKPDNVGYYNGDKAWQKVPKEEAEPLTHKQAHAIMGRMKRLGYQAIVEPIGSNDEEKKDE